MRHAAAVNIHNDNLSKVCHAVCLIALLTSLVGACEGTLACSTCHLIFKQSDYDSLPEKPADEELDMLDLAYGLTDTSV